MISALPSFWVGRNIVFVLGRDKGYTVKYIAFAWRSSRGRSPRELLKAKEYIWLYILSPVLIRTVYHLIFNVTYSLAATDKKSFKHKINKIYCAIQTSVNVIICIYLSTAFSCEFAIVSSFTSPETLQQC